MKGYWTDLVSGKYWDTITVHAPQWPDPQAFLVPVSCTVEISLSRFICNKHTRLQNLQLCNNVVPEDIPSAIQSCSQRICYFIFTSLSQGGGDGGSDDDYYVSLPKSIS